MMACLLGLLRTERLAREMSAVTRVIDILKKKKRPKINQPVSLINEAEVDIRQKDKQNQSAVEKHTLLHLLTQTCFSKPVKPVKH